MRTDQKDLFAESKNSKGVGLQKIKLSKTDEIMLYLLSSPIGCFFSYCTSERKRNQMEVLEKAQEKMEEDFDIKNIIDRLNRYELILKEKLQVKDADLDLAIDKLDDKQIIDFPSLDVDATNGWSKSPVVHELNKIGLEPKESIGSH